MKFKHTLIIALILALLGGYAYFIEFKGKQKKEEKEEKAKILAEIKKEDVAEIRIEGLEKPVRVVPGSGESWQITEPIQAHADESTVTRVLGNFEKLQYKEIIEEQPKDLNAYELDHPKLIIRILPKKGKQETRVMIGGKNPVDNVYYMRINQDPRVYIVDSAIGDISTTTLFELRDKKLTDFTSDKTEGLRLQAGTQELEFHKESGVWKMKKPLESPASENEISTLLSSLEGLRATSFVDVPSADANAYGFQTPTAVVDLTLEKGLRTKLLFGKKEGSDIYCTVEGSQTIAKVSDSITSSFEKKLEDWREKKVVVFNRFDVEEARFRVDGKDYQFKKGDVEKWNQLSPVKREIEAEDLQTVLEKLENAEISKYDEATSFSGTPSMEVWMVLKDWQEKITKKHLAFGPVTDNEQSIKNDDYGPVVRTHAALQQEIAKALAELKAKPPETKK